MSIESWLATTFEYDHAVVASDTALRTLIESVLTAAGWTEYGGAGSHNWQSPDPDRYLKLATTLPGGGRWRAVVTDYAARVMSERAVAVGAGDWHVYAGPYHLYISGPTATTDVFMCGVLDHFPEANDSHDRDVWRGGYYTDGGNSPMTALVASGFGSTGTEATLAFASMAGAQNGNEPFARTLTGVRREWPVLAWLDADGTWRKLAGRAYQLVIVPGDMAMNAEITVVIDEDTTATFKVLAVGAEANLKMAARKS